MSEQNFWAIRLGEHETSHYEYIYARYSVISISYGVNENLSKKHIKEDFKNLKSDNNGKVREFVTGMKEGDIVLTQVRPEGVGSGDFEYEIAIVVGDYKPLSDIVNQKKIESPDRPARAVARIIKGIKKEDLGDIRKFFTPSAITRITNKECKEKLFELLNKNRGRIIPNFI